MSRGDRLRARRRRAGPARRSAAGFEEKLLGVLSDKDSWDYATALFNSANQLRDRGDYEGAAAKIRRGLKEVIEGDALLALVRAENHRASDDERLASLRQLGIATNSLAVFDDYLSNSSPRTGTRPRRSRRPTACWGRDEGPPSDEELAPLGGEATGFELITQVYEPADEVRRMEVAFALAKNLRNTRIRKVHVLAENGRDGRFASTVAALVGATHVHVQILGGGCGSRTRRATRRRRCRAGRSS